MVSAGEERIWRSYTGHLEKYKHAVNVICEHFVLSNLTIVTTEKSPGQESVSFAKL